MVYGFRSGFSANEDQSLKGSFSSISAPIFASTCDLAGFFEFYKIVTSLHRSKLKISAYFRHTFLYMCSRFCKYLYFSMILIEFGTDSDEVFSEFRLDNVENS